MDVFALRRWFLAHRRDFPWRQDPTPYRVWISEVMLQQTQAAVVVPYFEKWMRLFPSIGHVAKSPIEELMKVWEGLGYYARVRQIHEAALHLVKHHEGNLPASRSELAAIPGIGAYTAGAILSFAFHRKAIAVDGNVARVLARYMAFEEEISSQKARQLIGQYGEQILPEEEPWVIVEALIELGATLCGKQPKCPMCPLQEGCQGLKRGIADLLPITKKRALVTCLTRYVAVVVSEEFVLLKKERPGKVMAGLYQFPYLEVIDSMDLTEFQIRLEKQFQLKAAFQKWLPTVSHHFTRYKATLYPALWEVAERSIPDDCEWVERVRLKQLPFSSGHRQILHNIFN